MKDLTCLKLGSLTLIGIIFLHRVFGRVSSFHIYFQFIFYKFDARKRWNMTKRDKYSEFWPDTLQSCHACRANTTFQETTLTNVKHLNKS